MILISFLPTAVETQTSCSHSMQCLLILLIIIEPMAEEWWRRGLKWQTKLHAMIFIVQHRQDWGNDSSSCKVRQALQDTPGLLLLASTWHNGGNLIEVYIYITFRSNNKKALQWGAAGKSKFSTLLDAVSTLWSSDHMYGIHVDAMKV